MIPGHPLDSRLKKSSQWGALPDCTISSSSRGAIVVHAVENFLRYVIGEDSNVGNQGTEYLQRCSRAIVLIRVTPDDPTVVLRGQGFLNPTLYIDLRRVYSNRQGTRPNGTAWILTLKSPRNLNQSFLGSRISTLFRGGQRLLTVDPTGLNNGYKSGPRRPQSVDQQLRREFQ